MENELKEYFKAGRKNLIAVYILYLCGIIVPVFVFIGAVISYINKNVTDDSLRSHYIFLVRTFVISAIASIIALITTLMFIGVIIYILIYLWFIARIVIGFNYLINGLPYPNPFTFWVK